MQPYSIQGDGEKRVLLVLANASQRYRFWHKEGKEVVKFKRSGARIVALTEGKVMVYKLPHAAQFHRELMVANGRALWLGLQADTERLIDNMLEYVETI